MQSKRHCSLGRGGNSAHATAPRPVGRAPRGKAKHDVTADLDEIRQARCLPTACASPLSAAWARLARVRALADVAALWPDTGTGHCGASGPAATALLALCVWLCRLALLVYTAKRETGETDHLKWGRSAAGSEALARAQPACSKRYVASTSSQLKAAPRQSKGQGASMLFRGPPGVHYTNAAMDVVAVAGEFSHP